LAENYLHILKEEIGKLNPAEKDELLANLRNEIDRTDAAIIELLMKRIELSIEIGSIKSSIGLNTYNARREKEIDNNIDKLAGNPALRKHLKRIYERIIDESRAIQREREK